MYQLYVEYLSNGVKIRDEDGEVAGRFFSDLQIPNEEIVKQILADVEKFSADKTIEAQLQGFCDDETVEGATDTIVVNRGFDVVEEAIEYVNRKINEWVEDYNYPDGYSDLEYSVEQGTMFDPQGNVVMNQAGGISLTLTIERAKDRFWFDKFVEGSAFSETRCGKIFDILQRLIEEHEAKNKELEAA